MTSILETKRVLTNLIRDRAAQHGDDGVPAFQHVEGDTVTWRELDERVRTWAAAYRNLGVAKGDTVLTMFPNGFDAYYAWLGLASLQAIEVPANTMYLGEMLRYLINDSQASIVVMSQQYLDRIEPIASELPGVKTVVVPDADGELPNLPFEVLDGKAFLGGVEPATDLVPCEAWDIASMVYTSGTTGPSKGVLVPWGELHEFVGLMPDDVLEPGGAYYSMFPAFHVSGKSALYVAAVFDARLVIRQTFSPQHFVSDCRDHGVTLAGLVGPMAVWLMAVPEQEGDADTPLSKVFMGPLIPQLDEFKRRFGVQVGTGFGMTEIGAPLASDGWNLPNTQSCGRVRTDAYPGYEVRVVDEYDRPLGPGEVGELIIRSNSPWTLNAGYWNKPEATARAWRNGWFHTGDGFKYDEDGNYYFVDRMKDAIRRRGENISSFEVEGLVAQHAGIQAAAAIGVPAGDTEDEIKVFVVRDPNNGSDLTGEQLVADLAETMPKFMVPRYVEFVDALPQTQGTFRTKKAELRQLPVDGPDTFDAEA